MAITQKKQITFYATMHVTRVEHWLVEADTPEQARELLLAGEGHRCEVGACVHAEVEELEQADAAPR